MKSIVLSLAASATLLTAPAAFAQNGEPVEAPEGTVALSTLTPDLVGVRVGPIPHCRPNSPCPAVTTDITVQFVLGGCVDALGPVQHLAVAKADGKLDLYVGGINIHTEASKLTRCRVAPRADHVIRVEGVFSRDDVTVKSLDAKIDLPTSLPDPSEPGMFCEAYFEGYRFDQTSGTCEHVGTSGCSNPFRYQTEDECLAAYGLDQ